MRKKNYLLILTFIFCLAIRAQVGINTTSPTTDLDVNGNVRIRNLTNGTIVSDDIGNLAVVPFRVIAAGKVLSTGTPTKIIGSSVSRISKGNYRVTFATPLQDSNYIIMLTIKDCGGSCNGNGSYDDPGIGYYDQGVGGFNINIGDSDNGNVGKVDVDLEFMFVVYSIWDF